MKKRILYILLLLCLNVYGYTSYNIDSIPVQTQRIGYTTQYGNGFNNRSTYGYPMNTPVNNNSTSGYSGGPRRSPSVPDYHDGEWDGIDIFNGDWWRYYITEGADKFWSQVDWSNPANQNNASLQNLWKSDHPGQTPPWEQYMTPIGEPIIPLMTLLLLYMVYQSGIRWKKQ